MTSLRFTLPPGQQSSPLIGAGVIALIALIAAASGGIGFAIPLGLIALGLVILYLCTMFGSFAEFDETGIRSKRGIFRNTVKWAEVREIKLDPKSGEVLMVYKHHGRPFKLGAPISGGFTTDRGYRAKVAEILAFAAAHTR
jgi:hypothetical protein